MMNAATDPPIGAEAQLIAINASEVRAVWPQYRGILETIPRPDGWMPEDIFALVMFGSATLFEIVEQGCTVGLLVLRVLNEFDGNRLHIWALHATAAPFDVMTRFSTELDDIGRRANCQRLTFESTRAGWAKVGPKHGFTVRSTIWQRRI